MPSPVRNPETVDEGALAEQARTLAEYLVQTQGQPDPQDARTRYHQIIVVNLETLFDRRQQRYNEEVAQLEAKVRSLKSLIEKRQQSRNEIIETRLQQLMREAEGLGW